MAHFLASLFLLKLQSHFPGRQFSQVSVWRFSLCMTHFSKCCEFPFFSEQTSSTSWGGPLQTTRFTKAVSQETGVNCALIVVLQFIPLLPMQETCVGNVAWPWFCDKNWTLVLFSFLFSLSNSQCHRELLLYIVIYCNILTQKWKFCHYLLTLYSKLVSF